jgi:protoheme IX farnesyltransferase
MLARSTTMPVALRDLVALTKPRLSGLVLLTCGGGMFLAPGRIDALRALMGLAATSMIVGAANALNCYMERDLDRHMRRTQSRPLPAGRLDPRAALVVAAGLSLVGVPMLLLALNPITSALGVLALASYVLVYTPLKQRSSLALWVGAVPGAIPPLMGWTAVRGRIELPGLVLFAVLFFWQLPHFIAISLFRKEDYARAGHKVLSLTMSDRAVKLHAVAWTALLVPCTLALTPLHVAGNLYLATAAVLGAAFLAAAVSGLWKAPGNVRWAKGLFIVSLVYLTALFTVLMLDAR